MTHKVHYDNSGKDKTTYSQSIDAPPQNIIGRCESFDYRTAWMTAYHPLAPFRAALTNDRSGHEDQFAPQGRMAAVGSEERTRSRGRERASGSARFRRSDAR